MTATPPPSFHAISSPSAAIITLALAVAGCSSGHKSTAAAPSMEAGPAASSPPPAMPPPSDIDCSPTTADWPMFGQNVCNTGAQSTAGNISVDTVKNLKTKWVYDAPGDISATPAVVGNAVYVGDWAGMVSRIDATTGSLVWSKKIGDLLGSSASGYISRTTPAVTGDVVVFGTQRTIPDIKMNQEPSAYLIALDPVSGTLKWKTLADPHLAAGITSSPVIDGPRLYVGVASQEEGFGSTSPSYEYTFRGSVLAVDLATGSIVWQTHTISDSAYYADAGAADGGGLTAGDGGSMEGGTAEGGAPEGGAADAAPALALSGFAGAAVWSSSPALDRKRHQIYVTTGNNYAGPPNLSGSVDGNWVDAILALDMDTGTIKWGRSLPQCGMPGGTDVFNLSSPVGPDSDFGCGANLFAASIGGGLKDLVGAGQKCGTYWALDADSGDVVWSTEVGPGGPLGGLHWGTSTDGVRVYAEVNNWNGMPFAVRGAGAQAGQMSSTGLWAALDTATGKVVWEVSDPAMTSNLNGASADGPTVVVNGVVFAGSMDAMGMLYALNAATGDVLWSFPSGGTVYGGPAIANGSVYWGCGYPATRLGFGTTCQKLYAFSIP